MLRAAALLMGPTGAGKSELALRLAEHFGFEIVSVDSVLVYRGMDIGTAKPGAAARRRVPHHLIDVRDPLEGYSAGDFVRDAGRVMSEIWARGRQPLLVGGTMLYFHALTEGIAILPAADGDIRAEIDAEARRQGWAALHRRLAAVDPAAAARIHATDPQRIQRALEVFRLTGSTITELQQRRLRILADVSVTELVLAPLERDRLHAAIARRFASMLADGFVGEVATLRRRGLTGEHPSMRAVGYRQIWRHVTGEWTLAEASEKAVFATRQLAKRQLTWLRRRQRALRFDAAHPDVTRTSIDALTKCGFAEWSSV
jgi:tRNA dimethylallyltransferase